MRNFIFLFLFLIVFLSGCTIPYFPNSSGIEPTKPLTISLSSDLTRVKSQDITYLYLILDNLDKKEKYKVSAKIINSGLFNIPETYKETELSGLQKKNLEFKLKAPKVEAETPSKVSVETTISKDFVFYLPILFADSEYLRECETRGEPVQKRQKTYSFSDNLIRVVVELNKEPPIDTGVAYANIKITPLGNGILEFNSISVGEGASCEEINKYSNSVSCEFHSGYVKDIEEKKFEVKIKYDYKEIKSLSFTILPEVAIVIPPEAEISLLEEYCLLNSSSVDNICDFKLRPIKWCNSMYKKDCIKDIEGKMEIEGDIGGSAMAFLWNHKKYIRIGNIDKSKLKNINYPRIYIDYSYLDSRGEERERRDSVIPIIILYKEKEIFKRDLPEDFKGEFIFLNNAFFSISESTEEQLRVDSICGIPKELSVNIGYHNETGDIMVWYIKDGERYRVDYYEFKKFKETIAKEKNPENLRGKTYKSISGAVKILQASEDKINLKAISGSSSGFPLSIGSHSEKCGYILIYEKKDGKYVLTIAKIKK